MATTIGQRAAVATVSDLQPALRGETPPLVTPFRSGADDESVPAVDHDALASVVEHVREGGVDGLFPCGTTGEFASMTADDQRAAIETVVEHSGDLPVLAGVSATAVDDAVARAEAAAEVGADAVVCTPPYFHGANRPSGTLAFFEAIAEHSPLPLLLYNFPANVGSKLEVETIAAISERPDVVGMKDTTGDLAYALSVARETADDFHVLQGYDTLLLPSLRMGLPGGINGLANVVPEAFDAMTSAPESEHARRASDAIGDLFELSFDVGFAAAVKTALDYRGVIDGDEVRPPLEPIEDPERRDAIADAVDAALDAL